MAKFEWNGTEFALVEHHGIKAGDFKKIKARLLMKMPISLSSNGTSISTSKWR